MIISTKCLASVKWESERYLLPQGKKRLVTRQESEKARIRNPNRVTARSSCEGTSEIHS